MSIAAQTPRKKARRPRRGEDRAAGVLTLVAPVPEPAPDPGAGDASRLLLDVLAAADDAVAAAQREMHRREAERRRAAAALEADLEPVRIDEAERARRRAVYVAAEQGKATAETELARTRAVFDAARLLADTLIDEDAPMGVGRSEAGPTTSRRRRP